jgi:hypothetical protein
MEMRTRTIHKCVQHGYTHTHSTTGAQGHAHVEWRDEMIDNAHRVEWRDEMIDNAHRWIYKQVKQNKKEKTVIFFEHIGVVSLILAIHRHAKLHRQTRVEYTNSHTHIHIYIYIYIHTYTHTYTHLIYSYIQRHLRGRRFTHVVTQQHRMHFPKFLKMFGCVCIRWKKQPRGK